MKTLKERIEIEQAYLDGHTIEYKLRLDKNHDEKWVRLSKTERNEKIFYWDECDYRIAPNVSAGWVECPITELNGVYHYTNPYAAGVSYVETHNLSNAWSTKGFGGVQYEGSDKWFMSIDGAIMKATPTGEPMMSKPLRARFWVDFEKNTK